MPLLRTLGLLRSLAAEPDCQGTLAHAPQGGRGELAAGQGAGPSPEGEGHAPRPAAGTRGRSSEEHECAGPRGEPAGAGPEGGRADAVTDGRGHRAGICVLRKEVIQPQVPLRLPCYDLVPITGFIFGACLAAPATSDAPRFGGLTGGVYKAQEHIHRGMLIRDY